MLKWITQMASDLKNKTQHSVSALQKPKMILASGSSSRKKQLENLGFIFTVQIPGIDEDMYKSQKADPREICQMIAKAKAEKIAKKFPEALVLAGDQMAVLDTEIFNKTPEVEQAVQALVKLQGKTHQLLTGLHICYRQKSFHHLEINVMHMRPLTEQQIRKHVAIAKPLNCAGSYALERCGISLFEKIQTNDQSAVIGFPLITLINQLVKWNISLPFL